MNNKKMIVIPALSKFENSLRIHGSKIKAAIFMPNKTEHLNSSLFESSLSVLILPETLNQIKKRAPKI